MVSLSNCASAFKNSRHVRWDRLEYAEKVASADRLEKAGLSQRDIAKELKVPRTTLQSWKTHRNTLDSNPNFIALMESSLGLAFIHRLCTAAHVVFVEAGAKKHR
jgi:ribosome-binding protein aMBF1 (putative translation factor)